MTTNSTDITVVREGPALKPYHYHFIIIIKPPYYYNNVYLVVVESIRWSQYGGINMVGRITGTHNNNCFL